MIGRQSRGPVEGMLEIFAFAENLLSLNGDKTLLRIKHMLGQIKCPQTQAILTELLKHHVDAQNLE